jgi:hypothetical protein
MVAPAELEDLVEESRPAVAEIVRRLVLNLAREEPGRIAATLNGRPGSTAEMVLLSDSAT